VGVVGFVIATVGLAGAGGMLLNGSHSDRTGERALHCIVPCGVMAVGFVIASYALGPWLLVSALAVCFIAYHAVQGPAFAVLTGFMAGRAAATGIAAMNTISVISGFVGPYWMGLMKDATGDYRAGLRGLVIPSVIAAVIMWALTRSLDKKAIHFARLGEEAV
jgi:ACS family tartrate transporter-like MFS transporter